VGDAIKQRVISTAICSLCVVELRNAVPKAS
jgi:hypothetical protein